MTQDIGQRGYRGSVSDEARTIAQALAPAGYRSFISGKWHLRTDDPSQHGFEEFYGTLTSAKRFFDPGHLFRMPEGRKPRTYPEGKFYATDAVTDHAIDFLEMARETPGRPWFLYLAFHAPHFPLHAPKEEIEKYAERFQDGWDELRERRHERMIEQGIVPDSTLLTPRSEFWNCGETEAGRNPAWESLPEDRRRDLARRMAIYAAMVDRMDQQIGRVVDDLKAKGEWENTLLVFTSDNGACAEWDPRGFDVKSSNQNILHAGDELDDMGSPGTFHSIGSGWANAANTPWRLYKHFNHEGGIASPRIVHWPGGSVSDLAGELHEQPAHIIDLFRTFLKVAGVSESETGPLIPAGVDLLAQIVDEPKGDRMLFFEHEGHRAVRSGKWKLVALDGEKWELHDFTTDRTELDNLAAEHPDRVKKLSQQWDEWAEVNFVTPLPEDLQVDYLKAD